MSENAWIEWSGGPMPVDPKTEVEVKWLDHDAELIDQARAEYFIWESVRHGRHGQEGDIIAYRLSGPSA